MTPDEHEKLTPYIDQLEQQERESEKKEHEEQRLAQEEKRLAELVAARQQREADEATRKINQILTAYNLRMCAVQEVVDGVPGPLLFKLVPR